jgi:regulator of replication initiation timing
MIRDLRTKLKTTSEQLDSTQGRIAELERQSGDLTTERNNLKTDLSRIGGALSDCRNAVDDAKKETRHAQQRLTEANEKADKLAFNLSTLIPLFKRHYAISEFADALVVDLFFVLGDRALTDPFVAMGWTEEKVTFWQSWYRRAHNLPTERIITLLHRSACSCTQHEKETAIRDEGVTRPLTNDDRNFLHSLLRSRGIDPDLEIDRLIVTHREEWLKKNRSNLQFTPPLSHREITPLSRVVRWNED